MDLFYDLHDLYAFYDYLCDPIWLRSNCILKKNKNPHLIATIGRNFSCYTGYAKNWPRRHVHTARSKLVQDLGGLEASDRSQGLLSGTTIRQEYNMEYHQKKKVGSISVEICWSMTVWLKDWQQSIFPLFLALLFVQRFFEWPTFEKATC